MLRIILILTAVLAMVVPVSTSAQGIPDPFPGNPAGIPICPDFTPPPACESTCVNDVTVVFQFDPAVDSCVKHFAIPCAPYGCDTDGITCKTSCITDSDCSQGALCDTISQRCTTGPNTCADAYTVEQANGQQQSCDPYRCIAGACQSVCAVPADCASGYSCNFDTGACVRDE